MRRRVRIRRCYGRRVRGLGPEFRDGVRQRVLEVVFVVVDVVWNRLHRQVCLGVVLCSRLLLVVTHLRCFVWL